MCRGLLRFVVCHGALALAAMLYYEHPWNAKYCSGGRRVQLAACRHGKCALGALQVG